VRKGLETRKAAPYTSSVRGVDQANAPTRGVDQANAPTRGVDQANAPTRGVDQANAPTRGVEQANALTRGVEQANALTRRVDQANALTRRVDQANAPTPQGLRAALGGRLRRAAASLALLLVPLGSLAGCERAGRERTVPDVVLVVADALRADRVRKALDEGGDALPNLTRLARDGVLYERAASPGTWCAPAFASLLTGRWPSFHGAERRSVRGELVVQPIAAEATTLAEILRQRGFHTAAFLPGREDLPPTLGIARGFTDFVDAPALAEPPALDDAIGHWLERRSGPLFLMVVLDPLRQVGAPEPDGGLRQRPRSEITTVIARAGEISWEDRTRLAAEYDAGLAGVDRAIGDVTALLQSAGRYAGALIVVTADHGELLGEHGLAGHGWPPFEDVINVPLVVKYPGGRDAGRREERRVSSAGVFATALEEVGVPIPDDVQAKPLDDHHPVWAEDVDRRGRRVRAGYDGLREKIIGVTENGIAVACTYDMYTDAAELQPDCANESDSPLRRAMASFSRRPRPGETGSGLAQAEDGGPRGRATN